MNTLPALSEQEQRMLAEIMRPGSSVEGLVPEHASAQQLWDTLKVCITGYNMLSFKLDRLKPIIGKILLVFQRNPHLYQELGYHTFEEFRKEGVGKKLGLGRTTLWETQIIARDWPQLVENPDLYGKIGRAKLMMLSKFAKGTDANANTLLQIAASMSTSEFRMHSEQRGLLAPGEAVPASVTVRCSANTAKRWREFASDPKIHQVVGSSTEDAILTAMMDECYHHWIAIYEQTEQENQHAASQL